MKLTVFQAGKGDCLLVTEGRTRVLVDGGMRDAYRDHVAASLGRLRDDGHELDLLYLSHIDQDHISGVLQLMEDELDWRVLDFQRSQGNDRFPVPKRPRPPSVKHIWHNAFHEQADLDAGAIGDLLAAKATVLETSRSSGIRALAGQHRDLATSIRESIELTHRVGPKQLGIPVNEHFQRKLAFVREGQAALPLGELTLTVIGPFEDDLAALRKDWHDWLRDNKAAHERLLRRMQDDVERLTTTDISGLNRPLELAAEELGDRTKVTVPNLASLMLLAEADGRSVLLTGDGHWREILRGLEHAGRLPRRRGLHVDVLKVQHHGSEHNLTAAFARRITAGTYVFCGNGEHANPDERVVRAIIDSRQGAASRRTRNAGADGPFRLVFNSSSRTTTDEKPREHMRKLERLVKAAARRSGGRLTFDFVPGSSVELDLD